MLSALWWSWVWAREPVDEAMDALSQGRDDTALRVLRQAVDKGADDEVRCLLGRVALRSGRPEEALAALKDIAAEAGCAGQAASVQAEALAQLGRLDEAASRYEALGETLLGPERHAPTARRLQSWAARLADEGDKDRAVWLLEMALGLQVAPEQKLALAREQLGLGRGPRGQEILGAAIRDAHARSGDLAGADRRLLAPLLPPSDGLSLLAPLPPDAATAAARVWSADERALAVRYELARQLMDLQGNSPEADQVRLEVGVKLADAGWVEEAASLLGPLARGDDEGSASLASWSLARLAVRQGSADAEARLRDVIARFPLGPHRGEAEAALHALQLERARRATRKGQDASALWEALLTDAPDDPALALERAWSLQGPDRYRALEEIVARWPSSEEAWQAARARATEAQDGWAWLTAQADAGRQPAIALRTELLQPHLAIRTPEQQGDKPIVQVAVRGVDAIELKLHRIDAEGYLRAGGTAEGLSELDVGIIAPDRTWRVEVKPPPGQQVVLDVPVPVPGPGLYAVTAATTDSEARTTLLVSDIELVVRAQGPELVAVAFREGQPVREAHFWVAGEGRVVEGSAEGTGLFRAQVPDGQLVILVQTPTGPAMATLLRDRAAPSAPSLAVATDLDRAVYLPGDTLQFRAIAAMDGEPLKGRWRLSLQGSALHQEMRLSTDAFGAVTGEITLPWTEGSRHRDGGFFQRYQLLGLPPGQDQEVVLAEIRVLGEIALAHALQVKAGRSSGEIAVLDGRGVPVSGHPVTWEDEDHRDVTALTDAAGRLRFDAPPEGLPWKLKARVPLTRLSAQAQRNLPAGALSLTIPNARLAPGQPASLTLRGPPGEVSVRLVRLVPEPEPEPPLSPPSFEVTEALTYSEPLSVPSPAPSLEYTLEQREVVLGDEPLPIPLPGLEQGRYRVIAVPKDGRAQPSSLAIEVEDGLRIELEGEPKVGGVLEARVFGGPALLTIEGGRMLGAAIVRDRVPYRMEPDRRWHGEVDLVAITPDDVHILRISLDAHLAVTVSAERKGQRLSVQGQVTDPAGRPVMAQVLVRVTDEALRAEVGLPPTLDMQPFLLQDAFVAAGAVARQLRDGSLAVPIAAELLAEARREADRQRAARAAEGRLTENAVRDVLSEAVPLEAGAYGLGSSGYGAGAGGFGARGEGAVRPVSGDPLILGAIPVALRGYRGPALWKIVRADRDGRFSVEASMPEVRAGWLVEAVALGEATVGRAEVVVPQPDEAWMVIDEVLAGHPSDIARPRVHVVAPRERAVEAVLTIDGSAQTLALGPGETRAVPLPDTGPGVVREIALTVDGKLLARQRWSYPLAEGEVDPQGELLVAVVGEPGHSPLSALALAPDPWAASQPGRAAVAGRAALAALPYLQGEERQRALSVLRAAVAAVREAPASLTGREAAAGLLLVAEAAGVLGLPRSAVEAVATALQAVEPQTPRERLDLAWARTVATGSADEATLGRLVRDAGVLDPEGRALLAVLAQKVGLPWEQSWVSGEGPEAVLASARLKGMRARSAEPLLRLAPPPVGHPDRPAFVQAIAPLLVEPVSLDRPEGLVQHGVLRVQGDRPLPEGVLSWRERAVAGETSGQPALGVVLAAFDGKPSESLGLTCGSERPCRLAVGQGLDLGGQRPMLTGGLRWSNDRSRVLATSPGRFLLTGLLGLDGQPAQAVVEISAPGEIDLSLLGEEGLLYEARKRKARLEDPLPLLQDRPSLEDWAPQHRALVAELRFFGALDGPASALVAAFEDLRDEAPDTAIPLEAVALCARAYRSVGRPDRALQVWQRAIGQAFLAEARVASDLEPHVGGLASIQATREVVARYPEVPLVVSAAFALPDRLLALRGMLPPQAVEAGVTDVDIQLMAAAWDREFVSLHPDSALAPEAGLRLATGLYALGAGAQARSWVERFQRDYPDSALVGDWMLLGALVDTASGETARARRALLRLAEDELPLGDGRMGPSALREDARFALGRLAESENDPRTAIAWYEQVASTWPEAGLSLAALQRVSLAVPPLLRFGSNEPVQIDLVATNVREVHVSVFAIDLRTVFLRDSGLPAPGDLRVEGLAPVWTGTRSVEAGPFPVERSLPIPLPGPGAWLVRLDGDGTRNSVLVVVSDLQLASIDAEQRQVTLRYRGQPARSVPVRAVTGSGITAGDTDPRGVIVLPAGAPALAQMGAHYAFTEDAYSASTSSLPYASPGEQPVDVLQQHLQQRERARSDSNRARYDFIGTEAGEAVRASEL